ncbi:MAG: hypothetical protein AAF560_03520 [Acidobacteriota bacterium]
MSWKQQPWKQQLVFSIALTLLAGTASAGPSVVPTAEGQIGETPGLSDQLLGTRFESIRGQPGDILLGGIFVFGGATPPPPEFQFINDRIHNMPDPVPVGSTASIFANVEKVAPDSAWARNAADDGDFVAFSFAVDGAMPETMTVRIATYDENGNVQAQVPIAEDIGTFTAIIDPRFAKTGVAVDNQGRVTVAYTELSMAGLPRVRATRADATTGAVIDPDFLVNDAIRGNPDVALLDPEGNRLVVVMEDLTAGPRIRGNIIDFSGGTPVVLPEFTVNTTVAAFGDVIAAVAADPANGDFTVVWEHTTTTPGDPIDVRGRRFDAMGNPIGDDFRVNTTTANAQAQPAVAYGPENLSAVAWTGDSTMPTGTDDLDVFLQVYDADGNPLGGEIKVNTFDANTQDRPSVKFLQRRDPQGRPQVAVVWRDTGNAAGINPRGTGTTYRCFSINGFEDPQPIFADGFESGDTSSWSDSTTP